MIRSFTGPKLQGDIGRFGNEELSDVLGYAELPDGKASLPQSPDLVHHKKLFICAAEAL